MGTRLEARTIALVARSVRWLWLGSLVTLNWQTNSTPRTASASHKALKRSSDLTNGADREAAKARYSFKYTNGTQVIDDGRAFEFSSERAARREALRTAHEMAKDVSWQSSDRGAGWTVLLIDPAGQQIYQAAVPFKTYRESYFP
jgi:hypothetical protein